MDKKSFVMYTSWAMLIENLNDLKAGKLIKAICAHVNGHDVKIEDETIQAIYTMISEKINEDAEKYSEVVEKRREAAKKKWMQKDANASKSIQKHYDTDSVTDTDTVYPTDIYMCNGKKRKRFTPPTVEQVSEYCLERQNNVNAEKFVDFYASKGWVVGKSPMKDWKAAVRNWEKDDKKDPKNKFKNFGERQYDMDALETELVNKSLNRVKGG